MKRWTNGLPGATKRLGAMMAQRGLSVSQSRMRADTHDGPEQRLHVRGLIHCCSSHVRRSWSFCLATPERQCCGPTGPADERASIEAGRALFSSLVSDPTSASFADALALFIDHRILRTSARIVLSP